MVFSGTAYKAADKVQPPKTMRGYAMQGDPQLDHPLEANALHKGANRDDMPGQVVE